MSAFIGDQGAEEAGGRWTRRAKGGKVKPGKHHLLIVMIGMRPKADRLGKRGLISEKAAEKRGL